MSVPIMLVSCACRSNNYHPCQSSFLFSVIISVQISNNGTVAKISQKYTLTCGVTGASVTTYQWKKDNAVQNITEAVFSFRSLRVSDAGQYTCLITVDGVVHTDTMNINITSKTNDCICLQ